MKKCIIIIVVAILILAYLYFSAPWRRVGRIARSALPELNSYAARESYEPNIPKIIHQIGPKDKSKWHSNWKKCHPSWKKHFPEGEYVHMFWSDVDDLRNFIKNKFPWFLPVFDNYPFHINRIDAVRPFILYEYGGIYADLDFECNQNFYDQLSQDKPSIVESPYKHHENLQNSLMASPKGHPFWIAVWEQLLKNAGNYNILNQTGPVIIDYTHKNYRDINVLPVQSYNPEIGSMVFNSKSIYSRHYQTVAWLSSLRDII
mgnify:FL=1